MGSVNAFPKKRTFELRQDKQELTREPDKGRVPYRGDMLVQGPASGSVSLECKV